MQTYASKTERNECGVDGANDSCEEVVSDAETDQESKQENDARNYVDTDEGDLNGIVSIDDKTEKLFQSV